MGRRSWAIHVGPVSAQVLVRDRQEVTEEPLGLHLEEGLYAKGSRWFLEAGGGKEMNPTQGFQKEPALRIPGR